MEAELRQPVAQTRHVAREEQRRASAQPDRFKQAVAVGEAAIIKADGWRFRLAQLADAARLNPDLIHIENPNASASARALCRVSSYSAAGSESATMPPPAWKYACPLATVIVRMAMFKSMRPSNPK